MTSCLSGCSHLNFFHQAKKNKSKEVAVDTTPVIPAPPPPLNNGAIYQEGVSIPLWEDQRARHVGDILTVVLQENTSSSKTSKTGVNKDSSVDLPAPALLGGVQKLATSFSNQRIFKGDAQADQSNRLSGLVSVTVTQVLNNGTLMIKGEKHITLTRGEEIIRIAGVVRLADIAPDNSVLSSKVANSQITYSGTGEFADSNHQGWLTRFFNSAYWPF